MIFVAICCVCDTLSDREMGIDISPETFQGTIPGSVAAGYLTDKIGYGKVRIVFLYP